MKSAILFAISIFTLPFCVKSQINKGTFHFGLEAGIANYAATTNYNNEKTNLIAPYAQFTAEIGIQDRIALGLSIRGFNTTSSTSFDTISFEETFIKQGSLYFTINYYIVNREHFNCFVGIGLGGTALSINDAETIYSSGEFLVDYAEFTAISVQLNGGINKYFGKNKRLGLRLGLHYTSSSLNGRYYEKSINGATTEQEALNGKPVNENIIILRGLELSFGISYKIGG